MSPALKRSFTFLSLAGLAALTLFVSGQAGANASTIAVPKAPAAAQGVAFGTSLGIGHRADRLAVPEREDRPRLRE